MCFQIALHALSPLCNLSVASCALFANASSFFDLALAAGYISSSSDIVNGASSGYSPVYDSSKYTSSGFLSLNSYMIIPIRIHQSPRCTSPIVLFPTNLLILLTLSPITADLKCPTWRGFAALAPPKSTITVLGASVFS